MDAEMDADAAAILQQRLRNDPAFFCREALGVHPWARQIEILEALRDHDRVAVRSGHGTGKSFVSACAALWFLYAHHTAKVVTTAPTAAQVRLILWSELRRLHAGARVPLGGTVLEERVKLGEDAFAVGLSTDEAERFQGFHAEHLLVVLDEAPGVRPDIWAAAETLLTGRVGKLLAIGNPTRPEGRFHECFRPGSPWRTVRISCLESPNLAENAEDASLPYPRLVTRRWIEARRREWGEDSDWWRSRVLGEFPAEAVDSLVPREWLDAASRPPPDGTSAPADPSAPGSGLRRLGVDVARHGDDRTVFVVRDDARLLRVEVVRGQDTMATAGQALDLARNWSVAPERVFVDDTGLGAGVTDRLREQGFGAMPVVLGARADEPARFLNRRAEGYWRLREALDPRGAGFRLGASEEAAALARELSFLTFAYASSGALKLEDKETLRRRLGASPDLADALALTFAVPPAAPAEPQILFL